VGDSSLYKRFYKSSLSPKGIAVIVAGSFSLQLFLGPWMSMTGNNKIGTFMAGAKKEDLVFVNDLLETGKVAPVIDRRYTLGEVAEAIRYLEAGHARGKIIFTVDQSDNT
jgi:NADPH:quinone reductase-like Zn-dependent oxidoreductase